MVTSARNLLGLFVIALVAAALLEARPPAADKETKIDLKKVPPVVLKAANKEAGQKVDWKQATLLEEDDEKWYEVVGVIGAGKNKRLISLEVTDDGEVTHVEEMIDRTKIKQKVPAKVLEAFDKAKYKLGADDVVFEVREDGKVIQYDFLLSREKPAAKAKGKGKGKKGKAKEVEEFTVSITPEGKLVEAEDCGPGG
ncbi:MAG: hypothetical protein U0797_15795 [Gemmataceae bacterium]